jgi:hypothetical protein
MYGVDRISMAVSIVNRLQHLRLGAMLEAQLNKFQSILIVEFRRRHGRGYGRLLTCIMNFDTGDTDLRCYNRLGIARIESQVKTGVAVHIGLLQSARVEAN